MINIYFLTFDHSVFIFLQIWSYLLKKSIMENLIFCSGKSNFCPIACSTNMTLALHDITE